MKFIKSGCDCPVRIDQEQQDKLVQPCIAAIRYAEAACSSGTFEFIHISSYSSMYNNFKAAPNLGNRGKINENVFPIKDGHSSCF
jgi:hypothetical protein